MQRLKVKVRPTARGVTEVLTLSDAQMKRVQLLDKEPRTARVKDCHTGERWWVRVDDIGEFEAWKA